MRQCTAVHGSVRDRPVHRHVVLELQASGGDDDVGRQVLACSTKEMRRRWDRQGCIISLVATMMSTGRRSPEGRVGKPCSFDDTLLSLSC